MNTITSLLEKIENSKALDFGDIFSKSIELFKKVWVQGLVMVLLMMVILVPFYLIMYLPLIGIGVLDTYQDGSDLNPMLMIPFFIMIFIFSIVAMVLSFGMKASFYRICKLKDLNEAGTDDYFYYLKKPYFSKVIALSLLTYGISLLAMLLFVLPVIYVAVPITLINVIFAFNPELSASDIIKVGFKLGNKKWWITFGLIIVSAILAQLVGGLMCLVGILVTTSFSYIPMYFVYKEAIGFNDSIEIIGQENSF